MAIIRKLQEIQIRFDPSGAPFIQVTALVEDSDEGTTTGKMRDVSNVVAIRDAVIVTRDAVLVAANALGKPLTF